MLLRKFELRWKIEDSVLVPDDVNWTLPTTIAGIMNEITKELYNEVVVIFCYDFDKKPLGYCIVGEGTHYISLVNVDSIMRAAMLTGARNIVICHNHPNGDPIPSREDLITTGKLIAALLPAEVKVLDHLIMGKNNTFVSLRKHYEYMWLKVYNMYESINSLLKETAETIYEDA